MKNGLEDMGVAAKPVSGGNRQRSLRAAFIDLDGTLLGPDKRVSAANLKALQRLQQRGVTTILASGRDHANIAVYARENGCSDWIVSSQGAMVKHARSQEVMYELTLPPGLAMEVHAWALARSLTTLAYTRHGVYTEHETDWIRRFEAHNGAFGRARIAQLSEGGLQKLLLTHDPDHLNEIERELRRTFSDRAHVVRTEPETVEVLDTHANKAQGAKAVAESLGFAREEVAAFGDGNNDVELLRWAAHSFAMAHGWPEAKRAARYTTPGGNPAEAFARAVEMLEAKLTQR